MENGFFAKKHNKGKSLHLLSVGPLTLDLEEKRAIFRNEYLPIPPCSFNYLATLLRHSPEPVAYRDLVHESQQVGLSPLEAQDLARLQVYLLRKVLEPNPQCPRYIQAVDGYGYRLVVS